jgi:hypothetical protein
MSLNSYNPKIPVEKCNLLGLNPKILELFLVCVWLFDLRLLLTLLSVTSHIATRTRETLKAKSRVLGSL